MIVALGIAAGQVETQTSSRRFLTARSVRVTPTASGSDMIDDMGTFRTDVEIENPSTPGAQRTISSALVDTA